MVKRLLRIIIAILIIEFGAFIIYPIVADQNARRVDAEAVNKYIESIGWLNADEKKARLETARAYNTGSEMTDIGQYGINSGDRGSGILAINGTDAIGVLSIPSLGVRLPLYPDNDPDAYKKGAAFILDSDLPAGTEGAETVIAADGGNRDGRKFQMLDRMGVGDRFSIYILGETLNYRVENIDISGADDAQNRNISGSYCTLIVRDSDDSVRVSVRGILTDERLTAEHDSAEYVSEVWTSLIFALPVFIVLLAVVVVLEVLLRLVERHRLKRYKL